uniref:Uncharacterized protein n=1 Tax=Lotharella globosa TaxID=91324 RepID=A0A7S3YJW6_9EUKA
MVKKAIAEKICCVRKNDPRFKPKKAIQCKPPNNGNPLLDPKAVRGQPEKEERKTLSAKFLVRHIKNNQGFPVGLEKHDKRDMISMKKSNVEEKVKLTGKITSQAPPKISKEKPFEMLRDNGKILSHSSTIASSASLHGVTKNITRNNKASVSKNKPIPRRDKLKYTPKPDEPLARDPRKPLTKPPTKTKFKQKYYKANMTHVKGKVC